MRPIGFLITFFIIQSTTATIDVQKLKETVQSQIQTLTETASENLQEIAKNIDLEKIKQYDVLGVLPLIQNGGQKLVDAKKAHVKKVKYNYNRFQNIKDKVILLDGIPQPVYRKTIYIYSK